MLAQTASIAIPLHEERDTITLMGNSKEIENPGTKFTQVLDAAAKLPGVRINRSAYLRAALK